eukprot:gene6178-6416_t
MANAMLNPSSCLHQINALLALSTSFEHRLSRDAMRVLSQAPCSFAMQLAAAGAGSSRCEQHYGGTPLERSGSTTSTSSCWDGLCCCVGRTPSTTAASTAHVALQLSRWGYRVIVRKVLHSKVYWTKSMHNTFIVALDTSNGSHVEYVLEPHFKEIFNTGIMSSDYSAVWHSLPQVFIGTPCQLQPVVQLLCEEMELSFLESGRACPPWRSWSATINRWMSDQYVDILVPDATATEEEVAEYLTRCCQISTQGCGVGPAASGMSSSTTSTCSPLCNLQQQRLQDKLHVSSVLSSASTSSRRPVQEPAHKQLGFDAAMQDVAGPPTQLRDVSFTSVASGMQPEQLPAEEPAAAAVFGAKLTVGAQLRPNKPPSQTNMGGGGAEGDSGILEASPGALAVLVVAFLVITLGLERVLHVLRKWLQRVLLLGLALPLVWDCDSFVNRNKRGLLAAVDNLASELMLLSVASLCLTALEPAVTKICLPAKNMLRPWLSNVQGCACCLARTQGVSECFLRDRMCPANFLELCGEHPPASPFAKKIKSVAPSNLTATSSRAPKQAAPAPPANASSTQYTPVLAPSAAPALSADTRGKRRRRLAAAAAAEQPSSPAAGAPDDLSPNEESTTPPEFVAAAAELADYVYEKEVKCNGPQEAAYAQCGYREGLAPVFTESTLEQVHMLLFIMAVVHIVMSVLVLVLSTYKIRCRHPLMNDMPRPWEYSLLRASFYYSNLSAATPVAVGQKNDVILEAARLKGAHPGSGRLTNTVTKGLAGREGGLAGLTQMPEAPAAGPSDGQAASTGAALHGPYLLECLERDGAQAVGLGLPMWLLVICFVLLSGAIGWSAWVFLILAGALLLVLNTGLLLAVRHITRGGRVRSIHQVGMWLRHPGLLLGSIKLMLFFVSFVFSNTIYFASFFGIHSCFFSRTGFQVENPVPWWSIMVVDAFLLLSLALVTLPAYSVVHHTTTVDTKLLRQLAQPGQ